MNSEKYIIDLKRYYNKINIEFLKNRSILITGATGLIGSYMIDLLMMFNEEKKLNIKIYALSRTEEKINNRFSAYLKNENFNPIIGNVCDKLELNNIDYIIHGASNTHPVAYSTEPINTITTNFIGLHNLLELASKNKSKRVLFLSSVEIYGENNQDKESFDEKDFGFIDCNTLRAGYPESKRLGEALCQAYIQEKGLDIVIPRISRVYGPTMLKSDSKALSQFIKNVLEGNDIVLKSDGTQYFSYSYVGDIVLALLLLLEKGVCGEAYNISDKESDIHLKDLAKLIAEYGGKKVVFDLPNEIEKKGFSKATRAIINSDKLRDLGYKALTPIKEGIPTTIDILKEMK